MPLLIKEINVCITVCQKGHKGVWGMVGVRGRLTNNGVNWSSTKTLLYFIDLCFEVTPHQNIYQSLKKDCWCMCYVL